MCGPEHNLAVRSLPRYWGIMSATQRRAEHEEVLEFVHAHGLMGAGISWIDAHLLASTMLAGTVAWTLDRRLANVADALGIRVRLR